jgi:hypothetical protein
MSPRWLLWVRRVSASPRGLGAATPGSSLEGPAACERWSCREQLLEWQRWIFKAGRALPVSVEGSAGGDRSLVPELSVRVDARRLLAALVRSVSPTWLRPNPVVVGALVGGA